jgi:hypothetical protein
MSRIGDSDFLHRILRTPGGSFLAYEPPVSRVSVPRVGLVTLLDHLRLLRELAAPAGTPAAHASVAASVTDHDGAAGVAAGGVAHVVEVFHGVGYVDGCGFGRSSFGGWLRL